MSTPTVDAIQPIRELVGPGLSDAELARRLGVGRSTLSQWKSRGLPQAVECLLPYVNSTRNMGEGSERYGFEESVWAAPLFASLRALLRERLARGDAPEEVASRASLAPQDIERVLGKDRIPLERLGRLCHAIGAEFCVRDTEHDTLELSEQAAEAWGLAPGKIRARALGRRLVRTAGMEPKSDPIEDALPEQPSSPDPRLVRLLGWIKEWWSVNEPDRRIWFFEDVRQRYPAFDGWLRGEVKETDADKGEVLR